MEQIELYVYECSECEHSEILDSDSVAPPEVHLFEKERVYCPDCEQDRDMVFLGLDGLEEGGFVMDYDTGDRYCPLCDGACKKQ